MKPRDYMDKIASQGCILCEHLFDEASPAQIHHLREGMGAGMRNSDLLSVPLCREHHLGKTGFHGLGRRGFESRYNLTELDLLAMTLERL